MEPRLKSSKKWTRFPSEFEQQIADLFKGEFDGYLKESKMIVEGRIYSQEILLRVGFLPSDTIKQHNFEVSAQYDINKDSAQNCINDCVDMAASLMATHIEMSKDDSLSDNEENELPRIWKEFSLNNRKVFAQYSTINSDLEAQANQLLGLDQDDLVHEDGDEEEWDAQDESEETDEIDDDDDSGSHVH